MSGDLTILCVSRFGDHAEPFIRQMEELATDLGASFVLGADVGEWGSKPIEPIWVAMPTVVVRLKSSGYIESVLDEAVDACPDGYILRLDDDETVSPQMRDWLAEGRYRSSDHWAFPRMHLWPDENTYITNPPLWPDLQTRLSVKGKSGGRRRVHQGSPYGTGSISEVPILHHKFIVRDREEREALLTRYERFQSGAGRNFECFSVIERYAEGLCLESVDAEVTL